MALVLSFEFNVTCFLLELCSPVLRELAADTRGHKRISLTELTEHSEIVY
jgi:hypothetical protein